MSLSQCCCLRCHFLFWITEEGESHDSQQLSLSLGLFWSKMGQLLSSAFFEGSPSAVWHDKLCEGEHKGAGEAVLVLQDQVMYWEERKLSWRHDARRTVLRAPTETRCLRERAVLAESWWWGGHTRRNCAFLPPESYRTGSPLHFCFRLFTDNWCDLVRQ